MVIICCGLSKTSMRQCWDKELAPLSDTQELPPSFQQSSLAGVALLRARNVSMCFTGLVAAMEPVLSGKPLTTLLLLVLISAC